MSPRAQRLRAELASDLEAFELHVATLAETDLGTSGAAAKAQAALSLHHAYGAIESAFERLTRATEGAIPTGDRWHKALLDGMVLEIPDVRPAFLDRPALSKLYELLAFRRFLRHAYRVELDADRLADLRRVAAELAPTLRDVFARMDAFISELDG